MNFNRPSPYIARGYINRIVAEYGRGIQPAVPTGLLFGHRTAFNFSKYLPKIFTYCNSDLRFIVNGIMEIGVRKRELTIETGLCYDIVRRGLFKIPLITKWTCLFTNSYRIIRANGRSTALYFALLDWKIL